MKDEHEAAWLLCAARKLWFSSRESYRDGLLEVGRLLQRFLLAKAADAAGLDRRQAADLGKCRSDAVLEAMKALRINRNRVYSLIATAKAVELLSEEGRLGKLSYASVAAFKHTVARKADDVKSWVTKSEMAAYRTVREEWHVKDRLPFNPTYLFRKAAKESWTTIDIGRAMRTAHALSPAAPAAPSANGPPPLSVLQEIARLATPRDLAEIIAGLISVSSDPKAVMEALARTRNEITIGVIPQHQERVSW